MAVSMTAYTVSDAGKITEKQQNWNVGNAQRDGRHAENRWRPLFNAAKFG